MEKALVIVICVMVLVFCLVFLVLDILLKERIQTEKRIKDIKTDKKEEKQKKAVKRLFQGNKENKPVKNRKELEQIAEELYNVGIKIPVQQFIVIWLASAIGIPTIIYMIAGNAVISIGAAAVVAFGPIMLIKRKKNKRLKLLEGQLVEAIGVMSNAMKAGHSFQTAMNNIAIEMEAPIAEEFSRVYKETQRGMTLEDSLQRMVDRCGSQDLDMLCTAIIIQRKVGGNLSDVLEKISGTVQSRLSLKAEIKTRTASGRVSGYIVGGLPFFLLAAISIMNPEYAAGLFGTDSGHMMLIASAVMEIIGFLVIKKIVNIKY